MVFWKWEKHQQSCKHLQNLVKERGKDLLFKRFKKLMSIWKNKFSAHEKKIIPNFLICGR